MLLLCAGSIYECRVSLPRADRLDKPQCVQKRYKETLIQRHYFKLTTPVRPEDENPAHEPLFPRLDQESDVISAKAMFGDLDAKWFANYYGMVRTLNATSAALLSLVKNNPMKTYADYKYIYHAFMGTIQVTFLFFDQNVFYLDHKELSKINAYQCFTNTSVYS